MRATAVIGANYGDEGKGLVTDWLASPDSVVVRFNGGAQAGHTVVSSAHRHVFSHFGAGTLSGASTYLGKHFVLNPLLFYQEALSLGKCINEFPALACDPRCYVTTPYDMIINQLLEDSRKSARHGSCGIGFGETIERNRYPAFRLLKSDLDNPSRVREKLRLIRDEWLPARLYELHIERLPYNDSRLDNRMLLRTFDLFDKFAEEVQSAGLEFLANKSIIFEGAQGLALDMDNGAFPHVTRSNTGLKNIVPIVKALRLDLDVIYVTRAYFTRHGAGPLPGETNIEFEDKTNVENAYQGKIRFAPFDLISMAKRIEQDIQIFPSAKSSIALTCLDQVSNPDTIKHEIESTYNIMLESWGPSADHVKTKVVV